MPDRFKTSQERWTYLILTVDNIQAQLKTVDSKVENTNKELHGNGGIGICEKLNYHEREIEALKQINEKRATKTWQIVLLFLGPVISSIITALLIIYNIPIK